MGNLISGPDDKVKLGRKNTLVNLKRRKKDGVKCCGCVLGPFAVIFATNTNLLSFSILFSLSLCTCGVPPFPSCLLAVTAHACAVTPPRPTPTMHRVQFPDLSNSLDRKEKKRWALKRGRKDSKKSLSMSTENSTVRNAERGTP